MEMFKPYSLKNITLNNRIVMPPMCMYSAGNDGEVTEFHKTHYMTRAIGGVGLIIIEATGVAENGRISDYDLGLWNDKQRDALKPLVTSLKEAGAVTGIQLNHGGRKYVGSTEPLIGPSSLPFDEESATPCAMSQQDIDTVIQAFQDAAKRADEAGFDTLQIHSAHGYLLHQFLSPISNQRTDRYGGSLENRTRLLEEVLRAVRAVWPKEKLLMVRVSATDYVEGGIGIDEMVQIINHIKPLVDMVDVSSGGNIRASIALHPGYQVPLAQAIKEQCQLPTIAVGLIESSQMVNEIIGNKRADLVALGRELLRNPYYVLQQARDYRIEVEFPRQYRRGFH